MHHGHMNIKKSNFHLTWFCNLVTTFAVTFVVVHDMAFRFRTWFARYLHFENQIKCGLTCINQWTLSLTKFCLHFLTYSMEQNPTRESNRFAASIPRILWNPKVHYRIHKCWPSSWASSVQSIPPHPTFRGFAEILYSNLSLCLPTGLFTSGFPTTTLYTPLPPPYALHALPI
jgi:hypothetical protein